MPDIGGPEILIILVIVVLLFGSKKIPEMARSVGRASSEFKKGIQEGKASLGDAVKTPESPKPAETSGPES
jgi:sec-independent protein translocase protein TatA